MGRKPFLGEAISPSPGRDPVFLISLPNDTPRFPLSDYQNFGHVGEKDLESKLEF